MSTYSFVKKGKEYENFFLAILISFNAIFIYAVDVMALLKDRKYEEPILHKIPKKGINFHLYLGVQTHWP